MRQRFEDKIAYEPTSGCWLWVGCINSSGYGMFGIRRGVSRLSHRIAYELYKGSIPNGMVICHTCDTPSCINPDHLWLGTQQENVLDSIKKGRRPRGGAPKARAHKKTTAQQRASIKADTRPSRVVAADHKLSHTTILEIRRLRCTN